MIMGSEDIRHTSSSETTGAHAFQPSIIQKVAGCGGFINQCDEKAHDSIEMD